MKKKEFETRNYIGIYISQNLSIYATHFTQKEMKSLKPSHYLRNKQT